MSRVRVHISFEHYYDDDDDDDDGCDCHYEGDDQAAVLSLALRSNGWYH